MRTNYRITVAIVLAFLYSLLFTLHSSASAPGQPTGNQNGASITIGSPLTGQVALSNCRITYTGSGDQATLGSNSDVENVTFTGTANVRIADGATGVKIIHCDLPRVYNTGGLSFFLGAGNIFHVGIGANQAFDGFDFESLGNNCIVTDNLFSPMHEGLHFTNGTGSGDVVQFNSFTGIQRHAIEIQAHTTGLRVANNYASNWNKNPGDDYKGPLTDSHIALSIATGDQPAPPATGDQIIGNAIDFSTGAITVPLPASLQYLTVGIEYMGDNGLVANNWVKNNGQLSYTLDSAFTSQANTIIGGKSWQAETGANAHAPTVIADQLFAWPPPASAPAMPANVGPRIIPGPASTAVPVGGWTSLSSTGVPPVIPPPAPAVPALAVTATNNADGSATFKWAPPAGATGSPTLTIAPTNAPPSPATMAVTYTLAAGADEAKVGGIPVNWYVTGTVAYIGGPTGSAPPVQVTGGPTPISNTGWTPVIWWMHQ